MENGINIPPEISNFSGRLDDWLKSFVNIGYYLLVVPFKLSKQVKNVSKIDLHSTPYQIVTNRVQQVRNEKIFKIKIFLFFSKFQTC